MIQDGLLKIYPHTKDYSFLPTYGQIAPDPEGLPANFSIYTGQPIPDQNSLDTRFTPNLPPMPFGCTAESGTYNCNLEDSLFPYNPKDLYDNTSPGGPGGRDIRQMLSTLCSRGPRAVDGSFGPKRTAYFNVYGSGRITDAAAARIALWINQQEKRPVIVGTWWYPEFATVDIDGALQTPSFNPSQASLHCYIVTGWRTNTKGQIELQVISWQGMTYGVNGVCWMNETLYNALLRQPFSGAFTITKNTSQTPVPIGVQAYIDHISYSLVQFIRNLYNFN